MAKTTCVISLLPSAWISKATERRPHSLRARISAIPFFRAASSGLHGYCGTPAVTANSWWSTKSQVAAEIFSSLKTNGQYHLWVEWRNPLLGNSQKTEAHKFLPQTHPTVLCLITTCPHPMCRWTSLPQAHLNLSGSHVILLLICFDPPSLPVKLLLMFQSPTQTPAPLKRHFTLSPHFLTFSALNYKSITEFHCNDWTLSLTLTIWYNLCLSTCSNTVR